MSPPPAAVADHPSYAPAVPAARVRGRPIGAPVADNALVAIGLVLASTVFFSAGDIAAKFLTGSVPGIEVTWLRYLVFCLMVIPTIFMMRGRRAMVTARPGLQVARAIAVAGSSVLFILGLSHLDVAENTAINFISPVFITALSIPFLGEKVGIRRWAAAAVGFAGVMLVVQPGGDAFRLAALLPMGAALCWAGAAISTRLMSAERSEVTLAWSAIVGFAALSALVPFNWHPLGMAEVGIGVLMGIFSTVGHWLIILAFRRAPASILAPFSYVQLGFSALFSFLMFGVVPGMWTFVGGAVIAASGLYTAHRERVRGRKERAEDASEMTAAGAR
jgi:drug/metabolite transporter (DMT)-like permease